MVIIKLDVEVPYGGAINELMLKTILSGKDEESVIETAKVLVGLKNEHPKLVILDRHDDELISKPEGILIIS